MPHREGFTVQFIDQANATACPQKLYPATLTENVNDDEWQSVFIDISHKNVLILINSF